MSPTLARPIALCALLTVPALFLRLSGVHPAAALGLLVFGAAVARQRCCGRSGRAPCPVDRSGRPRAVGTCGRELTVAGDRTTIVTTVI
jgi:hypothetical protein